MGEQLLRIGAHNIHYLINKRDRIFDPRWELQAPDSSKLWLNAQDIAIFADTKLAKEDMERVPPFTGFNMFDNTPAFCTCFKGYTGDDCSSQNALAA